MARAGNTKEEILHEHETPTDPNPPHPLLLITDRRINNEKQYLYNISENRFHRVNIPEFQDMVVLASAFGWIVLAHPKNDNCYVWNPSSMEKIDIGILKFANQYNRCVMSKPPSEPGYCHMMFYSPGIIIPDQCLLLDGQPVALPSYMAYEGDFDFENRENEVMAAASFREKIYCVVKPGFRFVTVEFDGNATKYSPIFKGDGTSDERPWDAPNLTHDWVSYTHVHMMESSCGQELLLVQKMFLCSIEDEVDFRVFRVDVDRKECEEIDNIGERAIFMSDQGGCFCCSLSSAVARGMYRHNCIYYTIPDNESRCVYVYDLGDRSTTMLLPCPAARRTRSVSNWIENIISIEQ